MARHFNFRFLAACVAPLLCVGAALAQPDPAAGGDDLGDLGEPDPARPPPAGKGVVWGVVTCAATKETIFDAQVSVVGTKTRAIADIDGRYRLELAPGNYELRVWYELYQAQRVQNVRVAAGKVVKIDVTLAKEQQVEEEVVEVEYELERANVGSQLILRKNAAQVGDAVSAQEIAKTPDRNAAEAAKRVVGATVVGNKYVYVRGLGERYTNSLLNGAPLPSPEPDRQAVPLDLFPALVISDVTILKTFTPDMPGDFAGGSVRVNTRELPSKFEIQGSLSIGVNSASTFAERLSYPGSNTDWLGVDSGVRALPKEIPDYKVVGFGPKPEGGNISAGELTYYGQLINAYMSTQRTLNLPNGSGNIVAGDTFDVGGGQRLGFITALTYGRKFTRRAGEIIRTYRLDPTADGALLRRNDYTAETGLDQVSWGGLAGVTWKPGNDHRVTILGIHSRSSDNEARAIEGFNEERGAHLTDTRLRFISRSLTFGQLHGEHRFNALDRGTLEWNASLSLATADEPDTRETVYVKDAQTGATSWEPGTLSGSHFFGEQSERSIGAGLDWTQPLSKGDAPARVKLGGLFTLRARTFDARRFRFIKARNGQGTPLETWRLPPDQLFRSAYIGTALELFEYTRPNDAYVADYDVFAGYLMSDASLTRSVRLTVGGRVEAARQSIDSFDPHSPDNERIQSELQKTDLLPAVSLVFKTTEQSNLRLALSKTVARPQLRELAPFVFTDYFGARDILGNPDLTRTRIYNADLRFEVFPEIGEVAAISVFYKQFYDPIETIILPTSRGVVSYDNAEGARNAGVELELRKGLGLIAPVLRDAGVIGNLTLVNSRVELDTTQIGIQTSSVRPLAGQSPFVINLGLDYSGEATGTRARILYHIFGSRIAQVGTNGLPDVYEEPRHQVDVTAAQRIGEHVDVKLSVENLLDAPYRFTQGEDAEGEDNIVNEYRTGVSVSLGVAVTN